MPNVAAGTDEERYTVVELPSPKARIVAVSLVVDATATAHASNYTDLALQNGATVIASHSTATGGDGTLTAGTAVPLSIVAGTDVVADGDVLSLTKTDSGTGVAAQSTVTVLFEEQPLP